MPERLHSRMEPQGNSQASRGWGSPAGAGPGRPRVYNTKLGAEHSCDFHLLSQDHADTIRIYISELRKLSQEELPEGGSRSMDPPYPARVPAAVPLPGAPSLGHPPWGTLPGAQPPSQPPGTASKGPSGGKWEARHPPSSRCPPGCPLDSPLWAPSNSSALLPQHPSPRVLLSPAGGCWEASLLSGPQFPQRPSGAVCRQLH